MVLKSGSNPPASLPPGPEEFPDAADPALDAGAGKPRKKSNPFRELSCEPIVIVDGVCTSRSSSTDDGGGTRMMEIGGAGIGK